VNEFFIVLCLGEKSKVKKLRREKINVRLTAERYSHELTRLPACRQEFSQIKTVPFQRILSRITLEAISKFNFYRDPSLRSG